MIGNVYRGEGFRGLVDYLSNKPGSRLLDTNLDGSSPRTFARQIGEVRHLYPKEHVAKPVCHIPLRPAPGEDLTDEQWNEVLHLALERMGFASSPYVAYLHDHGDGRHLHIATYRVTFEGRLVSDSNDRFRVMSVSREIEHAYSLSPGTAKHPIHLTRPALERLLRDPDRANTLAAMRRAIDQAASRHDTVRSFLTELHRLGVVAEIKVARNTGTLQGIRFALPDGNWIKGSDLGKDYSLAKICNRHELRIERRPEGRYVAMSEVNKKEYQTLCDDGLPPDQSVQYGSRRTLFWELPPDHEAAFVDLLAARLPHRFLHFADELPGAQEPSRHLADRARLTKLLQDLTKGESPVALPLDQFTKATTEIAAPGLYRDNSQMEISPAQLPDLSLEDPRRGLLDRLNDAQRELQRAGAAYAVYREATLLDYSDPDRNLELESEKIPFLRQATVRYSAVEAEAVGAGLIPSNPPVERMTFSKDPDVTWMDDVLDQLAAAGRAMNRAGADFPSFRVAAHRYNALLAMAIDHDLLYPPQVDDLKIEPAQTPGRDSLDDREGLGAHTQRDGLPEIEPTQSRRTSIQPTSPSSHSSRRNEENSIASATRKLTSMFEKQLLGQVKTAENLAQRAARNAWARTPLGQAVLAARHPLRAIARSSPAAAVIANTLGTVSETVHRSLAIYAELRAAHDRFRSTSLPKGHRTLVFGDFSNQSLAIPALGGRNPQQPNKPIDLPLAIRASRSAEAALIRSHRGFRRGVVSESQLAEAAGRALAARAVVTTALHRALEIPSYRDLTAVLGSGQGRALSAWTGALQRAGLSPRAVASSVAEIAPSALRSVATAVTLVGARRLVNWIAYHAKGVLLEENARHR